MREPPVAGHRRRSVVVAVPRPTTRGRPEHDDPIADGNETRPTFAFALRGRLLVSGWPADIYKRVADWAKRVADRTGATGWIERGTRVFARISAQLYTGIGAAVAITFIASLVAWLAFDRVGDAQTEVNEASLPQLAGSFAVAQRGSALAVAAPRLVGATTPEELAAIEASIREERQAFEIQLSALTSRSGERFDRVRDEGGALVTSLEIIRNSARERFELHERAAALRTQLADLESELAQLPGDGALAVELLGNALDITDAASLQPIRDRFEDIVGALPANAPIVSRLRDLAFTRRGVFELGVEQLALTARQQELLTENRGYAAGLLGAIETLVAAAQDGASVATRASSDAIATGRTLLVVINGISIAAALLIAWLFVGRVLLSRLQELSNRMLAMAEGDLEAEVNIRGRDEVADMAAALEVFRRHALEVQRLNLVEKLAEELRGKNDQLEAALEELRRAQNQIVAREKLAGLGELTAGVAHEIRNPLNFVFNYSEVSGELLEELNEELEAQVNGFSDEQKQLVQSICAELDDSLKRIRSHGGRADRIVRDMLKMGGATGERQPTHINNLLADQVRLALQTIKRSDADTPLDIQQDLDPDAGEVDVVPQEIGRVLQNLIVNAWYATDERRRAEEQAGRLYEPVVLAATRRLDDRLEIRVRDNGTGIPDDVVDKIFNPFFTTKPTDQGTGLGLSLCNDILRGHGGTIRVDTEAGSHTEMIVELPVSGGPLTVEHSSSVEDDMP